MRYTKPINLRLAGKSSEKDKGYIGNALSLVGKLFNNYDGDVVGKTYSQTLLDGTTITAYLPAAGMFPIVTINSPLLVEVKAKLEYSRVGIACTPNSDIAPDGWGNPFNVEGTDMGTVGGTPSGVLFKKDSETTKGALLNRGVDYSSYRIGHNTTYTSYTHPSGIYTWEIQSVETPPDFPEEDLTDFPVNRYYSKGESNRLYKEGALFTKIPLNYVILGVCVFEERMYIAAATGYLEWELPKVITVFREDDGGGWENYLTYTPGLIPLFDGQDLDGDYPCREDIYFYGVAAATETTGIFSILVGGTRPRNDDTNPSHPYKRVEVIPLGYVNINLASKVCSDEGRQGIGKTSYTRTVVNNYSDGAGTTTDTSTQRSYSDQWIAVDYKSDDFISMISRASDVGDFVYIVSGNATYQTTTSQTFPLILQTLEISDTDMSPVIFNRSQSPSRYTSARLDDPGYLSLGESSVTRERVLGIDLRTGAMMKSLREGDSPGGSSPCTFIEYEGISHGKYSVGSPISGSTDNLSITGIENDYSLTLVNPPGTTAILANSHTGQGFSFTETRYQEDVLLYDLRKVYEVGLANSLPLPDHQGDFFISGKLLEITKPFAGLWTFVPENNYYNYYQDKNFGTSLDSKVGIYGNYPNYRNAVLT